MLTDDERVAGRFGNGLEIFEDANDLASIPFTIWAWSPDPICPGEDGVADAHGLRIGCRWRPGHGGNDDGLASEALSVSGLQNPISSLVVPTNRAHRIPEPPSTVCATAPPCPFFARQRIPKRAIRPAPEKCFCGRLSTATAGIPWRKASARRWRGRRQRGALAAYEHGGIAVAEANRRSAVKEMAARRLCGTWRLNGRPSSSCSIKPNTIADPDVEPIPSGIQWKLSICRHRDSSSSMATDMAHFEKALDDSLPGEHTEASAYERHGLLRWPKWLSAINDDGFKGKRRQMSRQRFNPTPQVGPRAYAPAAIRQLI